MKSLVDEMKRVYRLLAALLEFVLFFGSAKTTALEKIMEAGTIGVARHEAPLEYRRPRVECHGNIAGLTGKT
jgi:hypothetical protein